MTWTPLDASVRPARRFEWERSVRDSELRAIAKHVGLTIATYGDADGTSLHPGAALLQKATSTSEATVRRGLRDLVEAGFLVRVSGGKKAPGRSRNDADEYRLTLPIGDHTDYQSEGLQVAETGDCWSESGLTGGLSDYPPEQDQNKTSTAGQNAATGEPPAAHREAIAVLLDRHRDRLTPEQAALCVDDLARQPDVRNLAGYARSLPLSTVLERAAGKIPQHAAGTGRATGPRCTVCGYDEAGCTARAAINEHTFTPPSGAGSLAPKAATLVAASGEHNPNLEAARR